MSDEDSIFRGICSIKVTELCGIFFQEGKSKKFHIYIYFGGFGDPHPADKRQVTRYFGMLRTPVATPASVLKGRLRLWRLQHGAQ